MSRRARWCTAPARSRATASGSPARSATARWAWRWRTGRLADPTGLLLDRYRLPQPRVGLAIAGIASAGMDVSDGLVQDLGHLCRAGGLAAEIDAALVPLSDAARAAGPDWLPTCLTGGDDYELLLAVPPARETALREAARRPPASLSRASAASIPGRPASWCAAPTGKRLLCPAAAGAIFSTTAKGAIDEHEPRTSGCCSAVRR